MITINCVQCQHNDYVVLFGQNIAMKDAIYDKRRADKKYRGRKAANETSTRLVWM